MVIIIKSCFNFWRNAFLSIDACRSLEKQAGDLATCKCFQYSKEWFIFSKNASCPYCFCNHVLLLCQPSCIDLNHFQNEKLDGTALHGYLNDDCTTYMYNVWQETESSAEKLTSILAARVQYLNIHSRHSQSGTQPIEIIPWNASLMRVGGTSTTNDISMLLATVLVTVNTMQQFSDKKYHRWIFHPKNVTVEIV